MEQLQQLITGPYAILKIYNNLDSFMFLCFLRIGKEGFVVAFMFFCTFSPCIMLALCVICTFSPLVEIFVLIYCMQPTYEICKKEKNQIADQAKKRFNSTFISFEKSERKVAECWLKYGDKIQKEL